MIGYLPWQWSSKRLFAALPDNHVGGGSCQERRGINCWRVALTYRNGGSQTPDRWLNKPQIIQSEIFLEKALKNSHFKHDFIVLSK